MNWADIDALNDPTLRGKRKALGVYKTDYPLDINNPDPNGPRINGGHWFENRKVQVDWYTDPRFRKNTYDYYEKINPLVIMKRRFYNLDRASYVPYIKTRSGKRYWLLGSFHDMTDIKVDFGGRCYEWDKELNRRVNIERYPVQCATRELSEETHDVLTRPILNILENYKNKVTTYIGKKNKKTTVFIFVNISDYFFSRLPEPAQIPTDPLGNLEPQEEDIISDYDQLYKAENNLKNIQFEIDKRKRSKPQNEKFGPLGFYPQDDILSGNVLTSFTLTDFVNNVKK